MLVVQLVHLDRYLVTERSLGNQIERATGSQGRHGSGHERGLRWVQQNDVVYAHAAGQFLHQGGCCRTVALDNLHRLVAHPLCKFGWHVGEDDGATVQRTAHRVPTGVAWLAGDPQDAARFELQPACGGAVGHVDAGPRLQQRNLGVAQLRGHGEDIAAAVARQHAAGPA